MFEELLRPYLREVKHQCEIISRRATTAKEARIIDCLEPVMNQHKLVIDRKIIEETTGAPRTGPQRTATVYRLFYQMTRLTREKGALAHDDRIDLLEIGVSHWVEAMAADEEENNKDRREEELRMEMEILARAMMDGTALLTGHNAEDHNTNDSPFTSLGRR